MRTQFKRMKLTVLFPLFALLASVFASDVRMISEDQAKTLAEFLNLDYNDANKEYLLKLPFATADALMQYLHDNLFRSAKMSKVQEILKYHKNNKIFDQIEELRHRAGIVKNFEPELLSAIRKARAEYYGINPRDLSTEPNIQRHRATCEFSVPQLMAVRLASLREKDHDKLADVIVTIMDLKTEEELKGAGLLKPIQPEEPITPKELKALSKIMGNGTTNNSSKSESKFWILVVAVVVVVALAIAAFFGLKQLRSSSAASDL